MVKENFAAWHELLGALRQVRELESLREENLRFKLQSEESAWRMLPAMLET